MASMHGVACARLQTRTADLSIGDQSEYSIRFEQFSDSSDFWMEDRPALFESPLDRLNRSNYFEWVESRGLWVAFEYS